MQETWVQSLSQEDPLAKRIATQSSILAWRSKHLAYLDPLIIGERQRSLPSLVLITPVFTHILAFGTKYCNYIYFLSLPGAPSFKDRR